MRFIYAFFGFMIWLFFLCSLEAHTTVIVPDNITILTLAIVFAGGLAGGESK